MLTPDEKQSVLSAIQNIETVVLRQLQSANSQQGVIRLISSLHRGIDSITQSAIAQGTHLACQEGCSHCCHARVEVSPPEAFLIAQTLKDWPAPAFQELLQNLKQHVDKTGGIAIADYRFPCPLLKNNICSIYTVRPAVCRKAHSLDDQACASHCSHLPANLDITLRSEALIAGTRNGYQRAGYHTPHLELGHSLLLVLSDDTAEQKWCNREPDTHFTN
jgi:Fe-S-cluster containining protein